MKSKYKKDLNFSYAQGTTVVYELLKNNIKITHLYIHSKLIQSETINEIIDYCRKLKAEIIYSDKIFNSLVDKESCFIIAQFAKYERKISNDNHVVLVNIANTGNLGTIMRTCLGFKIYNIAIILPSVDIFDPKTIRSSMGAIFSLNVQTFSSFDEYKNKFPAHTFFPFMLKAKKDMCEIKQSTSFYSLIFGNESSGLPDEFLNIGTPIIIKHQKTIDSLNLSNSASIALFYFYSFIK